MEPLIFEAEPDWNTLREVEEQTISDCKNLMRHLKGSNPRMLGAAVSRLLADLGWIADKLGHEDVGEAIRKANKKATKLTR